MNNNRPIQIANLIAFSGVSGVMGALLYYVFTVATWLGIVVTIIYLCLTVFGYRVAHVHTGRPFKVGRGETYVADDDELARNGLMSADEWQRRHPNG